MADAIKILLADDNEVVRNSIRLFLDAQVAMEVVAVAADGAEAVRLTRALQPDVVVLDAVMPVLDGIEATREITQLPSPPKVIILSLYSWPDLVYRSFEAGCMGYVIKSSAAEEITEAIRQALEERWFLSAELRHLQAKVQGRFGD